MSDQIILQKEQLPAENPAGATVKTENQPAACRMQGKAWFKGALGIAICCGAPILLIAAIAFFGLSLGAVANGALNLAALLACPVGMFLMMRVMMKEKKQDPVSRN